MKIIDKYYLFAIFLNRLKTQNRIKTITRKYIYAPSANCKLFSSLDQNYEIELLTPEIHKLIFSYLDEEIKKVEFGKIDYVGINKDNHLFLSFEGKEYPIYTTTKNKKEEKYLPFILKDRDLKNATIDHIPSFKSIMKNLDDYPAIKELSKDRLFKDKTKAINRYYTSVGEKNLKNQLWNDLKLIHSRVTIELVSKKYNTREE